MSGLLNLETALSSLGNTSGSAPMMVDTIALTGHEVPSSISIGGTQRLAVSELVGGGRVIRSMGPAPVNLSWSGVLIGASAQQRATQLDALRTSGRAIVVSFGNYRYRAVVSEFKWAFQTRGAIAPYQIECVVQPTKATNPAATAATLSSLVGSDLASGLTTITTGLSQVATFASTAIGQAQTIAGQITPLANLVGAGGFLASATDQLTAASALASAGTNLSAAPAAVAGIVSGLQSAGASLTSTISTAGANLEGISGTAQPGNLVSDMGSLSAAVANAGALSAAVDAGALANRALVNTQLAAGTTTTAAMVHS